MNDIKKNIKINELGNGRPVIIAGPCSVESKLQIDEIASELHSSGIKLLRGGTFKPRTSPNDFQGLGGDGIRLLRETADKFGMLTVTEILEPNQLDEYYDLIDIIQIGSRNMSSYGLLKIVGEKTASEQKPVLLKRGFSATIGELLSAAEYIMNAGNKNVWLCLRGIRTFEQIDSILRFTPDLGSILELKNRTDLPVIFDPSHSAGDSRFVTEIAKAAILLGADGLLVETHNNPQCALTDGKQSILPSELDKIISFINQS